MRNDYVNNGFFKFKNHYFLNYLKLNILFSIGTEGAQFLLIGKGTQKWEIIIYIYVI